jgi:peptidoglycan/LPS O-acetylase OafA/YrhL
LITLLDRASSGRENNLNAIRLLLAAGVILSHSFPISYGRGGEAKGETLYILTHGQESFGSIAVNLFFFISGMLITASWLRSTSMKEYLIKRVLRIYPGYIAAVIFSGITVTILCPEFRHGIGHGISWTLVLLQDCLFLTYRSLEWPGIFASNPAPNIANGSLWTIRPEFTCYLLVAAIGLFSLYRFRIVVLIISALVYANYAHGIFLGEKIGRYDGHLLAYFMVGMSAWLWRDKIPLSKWSASMAWALLACSIHKNPWFEILFPILGGYLTLCVGYGPPILGTKWTEKTDLSYGTYLYGFLVQQLVAMNVALRIPWVNSLIALPLALCCAWLSWHFVEKRFLALKKIKLEDYDPAEMKT